MFNQSKIYTTKNINDIFDRVDEAFRETGFVLSPFSSQLQNSYPYYNIIKNTDSEFTIELAVAGFKREDLDVELDGNTLTVTGSRSVDKEDDSTNYTVRGIAARSFTRSFTVAEKSEVTGAMLEDGILSIKVVALPSKDTAKKISIK